MDHWVYPEYNEYSYDAEINGRWNGAFSANALKTMKEGQSYKDFHEAIREILPSDQYPQSPQLEGSSENKDKLLFETDSLIPAPDPESGPDKSWFSKYWWIIVLIIVICVILYMTLK